MFTRPDNNIAPSDVLSSDIDNAELAARLGINRLRRSGRVVFYDNFTDGLSWNIPYNPQPVYYYSGTKPYTPPGMMIVIPPNSNPAPAITSIPIISTPTMGYEITYKLDDSTIPNVVDTVDFLIYGSGKRFGIRYKTSTPGFQYWRGTWANLSLTAPINYNCWHNLKFTVDFEQGRYMKLYYNRDIVDLSGFIGENAPTEVGMNLYVTATDAGPLFAGVYVDNVIVTTNES